MKNFSFTLDSLRTIRFYLEILALPFFVFLVIHLSGHGVQTLLSGNHEHAHEHHETQHDESIGEEILEFFSLEVLIGILFVVFFVWIWNTKSLKKWVPCVHEHCHESSLTHIAAIAAFCIHFFPEAEVRYTLIQSFDMQSLVSISTIIGFGAHFVVDIVVSLLLVSYFPTLFQKIISFLIIVSLWGLAYYARSNFLEIFPEYIEGLFFILAAFLLSMFVHLPHRPKKNCASCEH